MNIVFNKQISHCFEIPLSHIAPVYPSLQPASHLPVVMLHALSFRQCPVQLYRHAGPYLPSGHSIQIKTNIIHYYFFTFVNHFTVQ